MTKYANEMCKCKTVGLMFAYVYIFDNKDKIKKEIHIDMKANYYALTVHSTRICAFFSSFEFNALDIAMSG